MHGNALRFLVHIAESCYGTENLSDLVSTVAPDAHIPTFDYVDVLFCHEFQRKPHAAGYARA